MKCKCGCIYWDWIIDKFKCKYCNSELEEAEYYKYDYTNKCLWEKKPKKNWWEKEQ